MWMLTLVVMMPVLFWYFYTITDPQRPSRGRRGGDWGSLGPEAVRLPPRRRFSRSRRNTTGFRAEPARREWRGSSGTAHPMWDRWIDG
jgi:hypothetical protein